ncbi:hypothetical protein, partial [Geobacillus thermoleovorans]|uniref:hypothetical protein n=1 Tax=Geobacillus thermoleovorans TaxID=33941 RepID=UPI003D220DB2
EGLRGGSNQAKLGSAWVASQERKQCVAAAAGPKRREPMAAGTRQRKAQASGGEPELDNAKSAGERLLPTVI